MFRRQIFYGITLILLVVIIFMLMRGRSAEEKKRAEQNVMLLEEAEAEPPPSVRAVLPRDLQIIDAKVSWTRNPDEKDAVKARHGITVRNTGEGSYSGLWIKIEYLNDKKHSVETRTREIGEPLPPGGTLRASDIDVDNLPDAASDFRVSVLSADLAQS